MSEKKEQFELATRIKDVLQKREMGDFFRTQLDIFLDWIRRWESENKRPLSQLREGERELTDWIDRIAGVSGEMIRIQFGPDPHPEEKSKQSDRLAQLDKERNALKIKKTECGTKIEHLKVELPDSPWDQYRLFPDRPEDSEWKIERLAREIARKLAHKERPELSDGEKQLLDFMFLAIFLNKSTDRRLVKHTIFDCRKDVDDIWGDMREHWGWWRPVLSQALGNVRCYFGESLKTDGADTSPISTASPQKSSGELSPKNKRKRPTKAEMANRNKTVAYTAGQFKVKHGRLPSVDEVAEETKLTHPQIRATDAYKNGKIAKSSAKVSSEILNGSVSRSQFFDEGSEQHGREANRSKSDQAEVDALIEKQAQDDSSDHIPTEKKH